MAMTDQKVREAAEYVAEAMGLEYRRGIRIEGVGEKTTVDSMTVGDVKCHLAFMVKEITNLLEEGRREKAMRWLGFLQGVAWVRGDVTLEELKNSNKPDEAPATE